MNRFEHILQGGDLRSIGKSGAVVQSVSSQADFDALFQLLYHADRKIVMRAADAIEKITFDQERYLAPHKKAMLVLFYSPQPIEVKWHLALLVPRLPLTNMEVEKAWAQLSQWALNKEESRIVRVNAIQALSLLVSRYHNYLHFFKELLQAIEKENVPSISARIRKLRKTMDLYPS